MNPELVSQFEAAGLRFVGKDDTGTRMEIVELANHPFFVAAQVGRGAGTHSCPAGKVAASTGYVCPAGCPRSQPGAADSALAPAAFLPPAPPRPARSSTPSSSRGP